MAATAVPAPEEISFTRFEVELEFVQCLANPKYLAHLAFSKYFEDERFLNYLEYLEYFRKPEYAKLLTYPAYSLSSLSLLKQPAFRQQILNPEFVNLMYEEALGLRQSETAAPAEGTAAAAAGEETTGQAK